MQGVFRNVQVTRLVPDPARGYPAVDARQPVCGRESCEEPNRKTDDRQDNPPTLGPAAGQRQDEGLVFDLY